MKYAIVVSGGKQYKAVEGVAIEVDRLPAETGANIKLEQVLLLADGEQVAIGTPLLKDTPVWAKVIEHFKGPKVVIFNYRPKKRIRVKTGHRQHYTRLMIEQIGGSALAPRKGVEKVAKSEVAEPARAGLKEQKAAREETKTEKKPAKAASARVVPSPKGKKPSKAAPSRLGAKKPAKTTPAKPAARKMAQKKATKPASPKGKKPSSK